MRKDRLMNKSVKQAEKETGASPYIKRCGEYTVEVEFAGSCSLESCLAGGVRDWNGIKSSLRDSLSDYIYMKTKRNPMILPIIEEI